MNSQQITLIPFSPQKQNSPQRQSSQSFQYNSPQKQKQYKKLKIQLSDKIFELKKMQQDFAEQKAHIMMQYTQQKNYLNAVIKQLKAKIVEENQHWVGKFDQLKLQNQSKIQEVNKTWQARINRQVSRLMSETRQKYTKQLQQLTQTLTKQTQKLQQKQKTTQKSINSVKQLYKLQIIQINQSHQNQLQQLKKKYQRDEQIKINAIMHIKNSQQKQHALTKNLLLKCKRQYEEYIKNVQERVFQLNQEIWSLKKKLAMQEQFISQQKQLITKLEQNKISEVVTQNRQYEEKLQKSTEQWKQTLQSLNQKWKNQYKKVQQAYEKISCAFEEKQKLWQERGNKVLKLYEIRQARQQDVKLIEQLQVQLIKKQFQLERQKQELKSCKLELDNMDDIYKRIFNSVKKNNRHSYSFHLKKMKLPGIGNKSTHPVKEMN